MSNDDGLFSDPFTFEAGFVRAGRESGSDGTIQILDGAILTMRSGIGVNNTTTAPGLQIARNDGSVGSVLVDNATVNILQTIVEDGNGGSFLQVGRAGEGEMTIRNSGTVNVTGFADAFAVVGAQATGVGDLTVEGTDSSLNIVTNNASDEILSFGSNMFVGNAGTGTLNVEEGGQVNIEVDYVAKIVVSWMRKTHQV